MKKQALKNLMILFLIYLTMGNGLNAQISENVSLLYHWTNEDIVLNYRDARFSEVWGFVHENREYGVIGSTYGTHIFDVTDPFTAYPVDSVPGAVQGSTVNHRDFHDYNGYLYGVADQGEATLQIIDLHDLPNSVSLVYNSNILVKRAHNVFIDSDLALMFICGPSSGNGMEVYTLENPIEPALIYTFTDYYVHDVYSKNGIVYMHCGTNGMIVMDFSEPSSPIFLGDLLDYPDKGYNHSGWLNETGDIYAMADENYGLDIKICDVSNLGDISVLSTINSNVSENSIAHNVMIKNGFLYVSYYNDGFQLFNIKDPNNPIRAGYYDTYDFPQSDDFRGAWGVYAFLPSGNVLIADRNTGFYVLDPSAALMTTEIDEEKNNDLKVFPNPANSFIEIENNDLKITEHDMYLYNSIGQKIEFNVENKNNSIKLIPTGKINNGIYYLNILKEKNIINKRIIFSNN